MAAYLDSLKWSSDGLVAVIAQVRRAAMRSRRRRAAGGRRARSLRLLCARTRAESVRRPPPSLPRAAARRHRRGAHAGVRGPQRGVRDPADRVSVELAGGVEPPRASASRPAAARRRPCERAPGPCPVRRRCPSPRSPRPRAQAGHFLQPQPPRALVQGRDVWPLHPRVARVCRLRRRLDDLPGRSHRARLPHGRQASGAAPRGTRSGRGPLRCARCALALRPLPGLASHRAIAVRPRLAPASRPPGPAGLRRLRLGRTAASAARATTSSTPPTARRRRCTRSSGPSSSGGTRWGSPQVTPRRVAAVGAARQQRQGQQGQRRCPAADRRPSLAAGPLHGPARTLGAPARATPNPLSPSSRPRRRPEGKPSWTARLLSDPSLLCKKVREEAGELCETLEAGEGRERAASEMADLLYHSMVLLNLQARRTPRAAHVQGRFSSNSSDRGRGKGAGGGAAAGRAARPRAGGAASPRAAGGAALCKFHARASRRQRRLAHELLTACTLKLAAARRPQGVGMEEVLRVLRKRFGTSGIEEKAARPPKQ
jgi:phosphoribosyl-ATP pyrophosphohydrolase